MNGGSFEFARSAARRALPAFDEKGKLAAWAFELMAELADDSVADVFQGSMWGGPYGPRNRQAGGLLPDPPLT